MYYDAQADENKPVGVAFFLSVFNNYKSSFCSSYFLKFNHQTKVIAKTI